mmetsp:Transcript_45082/g.144414  ORF Transcript_45082/g.144414 Transcript_45082/m.144414 type:complete len:228 (-) Transcript_45082:263-946(-)
MPSFKGARARTASAAVASNLASRKPWLCWVPESQTSHACTTRRMPLLNTPETRRGCPTNPKRHRPASRATKRLHRQPLHLVNVLGPHREKEAALVELRWSVLPPRHHEGIAPPLEARPPGLGLRCAVRLAWPLGSESAGLQTPGAMWPSRHRPMLAPQSWCRRSRSHHPATLARPEGKGRAAKSSSERPSSPNRRRLLEEATPGNVTLRFRWPAGDCDHWDSDIALY